VWIAIGIGIAVWVAAGVMGIALARAAARGDRRMDDEN
jgi:type IV secretory pathway TrbD component